ncbi:FkbM family methyltransferase [Pseudanabaena mucicola]|uniref:FkbM family methyltransferase n=1 Tax=Pseudanabaena mucicola FACHB-723 TaxID=2692860 RepID=A0ABR7ZU77_9CYAN|nr:FkbM family methyltransferase [Pseudanabaena mucicola]MBD2187092.1 FkbM family methyltransferase [Pseudanabaena mucicola FACHB-723]
MFTEILKTWRFIRSHPLSSQNLPTALSRWLKWQIGSRILNFPVVIAFVGDSQLVVERGMTGATGNIYAGLHEFADMAFCLHLLRPDDLFVDVGANIGSYTIIASKVVRANSLALEPVPETFKRLQRNINLNDIASLVDARCCAAGLTHGSLMFSDSLDTMNKVVNKEYSGSSIEVPVKSLDSMLDNLQPTLIKIDVEGFEPTVIAGAVKTLLRDSLLAILIETVTPEIRETLQKSGFKEFRYDPFKRELLDSEELYLGNNYLWIRNPTRILDRCKSAPIYQVLGVSF